MDKKEWISRDFHEKALSLKRKELRWKLMEASHIQNKAKLEEIRTEADYYRKKVNKITTLANKLRDKYIKVAKAGRIAETLYKRIENELLTQEKFVAEAKMQSTRLAVDCRNIGAQLYGAEYKLTINQTISKDKERQRLASKLGAAKLALNKQLSLIETKRKATKNSTAKKLLELDKTQESLQQMINSSQSPPSTRLSSLYDLKNSPLRNLASYRLTSRFEEAGFALTDLSYTHSICANCHVCLPDLIGTCTDRNCLYQHKSNYIMSDIDKLADILSYQPSLTGFKHDENLSKEENINSCRNNLKLYAARLIAKNYDKTIETIAQNLVKYLRLNKPDHDLLTTVRELPKVSHTICNIPQDTLKLSIEKSISGSNEDLVSQSSEESNDEPKRILFDKPIDVSMDISCDGSYKE